LAILKIAQMGHPILRRIADPVTREELGSERIQRLIDDMVDTMREYQGVGLAAPQVHVPRQIIVIESSANDRYPSASEFPLTVLVNPVITERGEELVEGWEGCLSVEGLRGRVPRSRSVTVDALDRAGKPVRLSLSDYPAVVAQHETDHLQGVLFPDRMKDLRTLTFLREYSRFWGGGDDPGEPED
jgi:peptide deformylase